MPYTREQSDKIMREAQAATGRKINVDGDPITGLTLRDPFDQNKVVGTVPMGRAAELGSVDFVDGVEVDASLKPAEHPYQGFPTVNITDQPVQTSAQDVAPEPNKPGDLTSEQTLEDAMGPNEDDEKIAERMAEGSEDGEVNPSNADSSQVTDKKSKK